MNLTSRLVALLVLLAVVNVSAFAVIDATADLKTTFMTLPPLMFAQMGLFALAAVLSDRRGWHRWAATFGLLIVLQLIFVLQFRAMDWGLPVVTGLFTVFVAVGGLFLRNLGIRWGDAPSTPRDGRFRYSLRAILIATTVVACVALAIRFVAQLDVEVLADLSRIAMLPFFAACVAVIAAFASAGIPGWPALLMSILFGSFAGYQAGLVVGQPEVEIWAIAYALYGGLLQIGFMVSRLWGWRVYGPQP